MDYDPYDEQFYNDDDLCESCRQSEGSDYYGERWLCDGCVEALNADPIDEPEDEWLEGYWEDRLTDMYDGTY